MYEVRDKISHLQDHVILIQLNFYFQNSADVFESLKIQDGGR